MYFEVKVKYSKQDDNGAAKQVTELFVFEQHTFGSAEEAAYKHLDSVKGEVCVLAIKKMELDALIPDDEKDLWHLCKAKFVNMDDKKQTYVSLICAATVWEANRTFLSKLEESGIVQPEVQSVVLTKIVEVVESVI